MTRSSSAQVAAHGGTALDFDDRLTREEEDAFTRLLLATLPRFYDEVDVGFPRSILESARAGLDVFGHFTEAKKIFVARTRGEAVGFTVATYKRGGSVKMGPTAVLLEHRQQGIASALRNHAEGVIATDPAVRKLFLTVSNVNAASVLFNLSLGYQIEGVLEGQYREGSRELVMGRFVGHDPRVYSDRANLKNGSVASARSYDPVRDDLHAFMLPRLSPGFGPLDSVFVDSTVSATGDARQSLEAKGKTVLVAVVDHELVGCAVLTPKRGGAVKLVPFLADSPQAVSALLESVRQFARARNAHRIYTMVPTNDGATLRALLRDGRFRVEAQLREPYADRRDLLVLGERLD